MKKFYLTILLAFYSFFSLAQAGEWIWISGSDVPNGLPVFGTQGVPSVSNNPGAIYKSRSLSAMIRSAESTRNLKSQKITAKFGK